MEIQRQLDLDSLPAQPTWPLEAGGPAANITGKGLKRRRRIIDVAAALFDAHGYHNTSIEAVCEAAGIAKPTLYHYFKSKDELLYCIHHEFISLLIRRQQERARSSDDPAEQLRFIMRDLLELIETHRGHVRVFFEHHSELPAPLRADVKAQRDAYRASVEGVIQKGIAIGRFRKVDVRMTTLALFGMCNWSYQWYQKEGPLSAADIADQFVDLLLQGIAA